MRLVASIVTVLALKSTLNDIVAVAGRCVITLLPVRLIVSATVRLVDMNSEPLLISKVLVRFSKLPIGIRAPRFTRRCVSAFVPVGFAGFKTGVDNVKDTISLLSTIS